jgi:Uma2 family endonuclease
MNTMHVAQRMTADEYLALPEDGIRTMLVEGEVVVNRPGLLHQVVLVRLVCALELWATEQLGRGRITLDIDVKLDERNVFGPDLLWYAEGHMPDFDARAPHPLPDLAVEVRSPPTWRYDVGTKMLAYERAGLAELWLIDTVSLAVLVSRRSDPASPTFDVPFQLAAGDELTSPQLAGFALALSSLFAD